MECAESAVLQFQGRHPFRAIDHHWRDSLFATAGAAVEVWSHERSEPVNTFSWGADAVLSVRFNPVRGGPCVASKNMAQAKIIQHRHAEVGLCVESKSLVQSSIYVCVGGGVHNWVLQGRSVTQRHAHGSQTLYTGNDNDTISLIA